MLRLGSLSVITAACFVLMACESRISNHGFAPEQEILETVQAGSDTRGSVRRKVGRPSSTGVFTDKGWYYIATTIERDMYKEPKVIDRRIVAITFDDNDVVASVDQYGLEDGRIVDLQTRTTPTAGRELTILEQALGNIGLDAATVFE
ncbi:MAG: outer membrane protein assembly factor BamE [Pseudomonadota bacterium]